MISVLENCKAAHDNGNVIQNMSGEEKNRIIALAASAVLDAQKEIIRANKTDLNANADMPAHMLDRLMLNEQRIADIAEGLKKLIDLPDPIGEVLDNFTQSSGLKIKKIRVPLGVIGIIYEARPNVTVDAIGLCLKTGNAVVLRGSKHAYNSNKALAGAIKARLSANGYNAEFIQLIEDMTHEGAETLMKCREYVDVLIPRGSANLIRSVVDKSTVPVIETGVGNCHLYIEKTADIEKAKAIALNGKLQRPSVCNALESILMDEEIAATALPEILGALKENCVEIFGCEKTAKICPYVHCAIDADYAAEYLSLKISCKIVKNTDEAILHINRYGSKHSDAIMTNNNAMAERFLQQVDSAVVYVNASTRFTDGFEFGFGAEMGISTQKLHARGPLGLHELTSVKYQIVGTGQTRK